MKKLIMLGAVMASFLVGLPGFAQEMPPGNVIVNTACSINEGHTFDEVLEVARANSFDGDNAPNLVFYRRPIAGANFAPNFVLRVVYWDNMEHWARSNSTRSLPATASAGSHLNELLTCDNVNRSFSVNRNVGQGAAYGGGENSESLVGSVRCRIAPGRTMQEVYAGLSELNAPFAAQGDTTLMQVSNRILGPREGLGLGSGITVRLIGETAVGLAARLDMQAPTNGTPPDAPVTNCGVMALWSSHVVRWGI